MKLLKSGLMLYLFLGLWNCSPKNAVLSYSGIYYISSESTTDVICLEGMGASSKKERVLEEGIQLIFETLLYRGIPDSPHRAPIIAQNSSNHQAILQQLSNGDYSKFVTEAWLLTPASRPNKQTAFSARVRVLIDINGLKRTLQAKGVIPKFGL